MNPKTKRLNIEAYWQSPPPEPSPKLAKWVSKIRAGWRLNRRIGGMGYYGRCEFFGVYLWEYFNVLLPLLEGEEPKPAPPAPDVTRRQSPGTPPPASP